MLFDEGAISISASTLAACSAGDLQLQCLGRTVGALHSPDAAPPFLQRTGWHKAVKGHLSPQAGSCKVTLEHVSGWASLPCSPMEQGCL